MRWIAVLAVLLGGCGGDPCGDPCPGATSVTGSQDIYGQATTVCACGTTQVGFYLHGNDRGSCEFAQAEWSRVMETRCR